MRIKQISVKGLFNTFNYIIPLNLADRITILHGPNGYGKTILLNMLDGLFNNQSAASGANESIFFKIPFSEFQVDFDDENCLLLTKNNGLLEKWPFSNQETLQYMIPVYLLDTQRLHTVFDNNELGRISKNAQHLANLVQSKLAESTRLSQALDSTFPRRLIEQKKSSISLKELRERLEALEKTTIPTQGNWHFRQRRQRIFATRRDRRTYQISFADLFGRCRTKTGSVCRTGSQNRTVQKDYQ
jgi:energy-coupling factor transporter ATP-binding protein EcfA2